jgi:hypothetical protein
MNQTILRVGLDDDDDDKIKSETRGLDNMIEDPDKITNL